MCVCILSSGQVWRRCGHRFNYSWPAQSQRERERSSARRVTRHIHVIYISLYSCCRMRCMCRSSRPLRLILKCSFHCIKRVRAQCCRAPAVLRDRCTNVCALWELLAAHWANKDFSRSSRWLYICINYCASDLPIEPAVVNQWLIRNITIQLNHVIAEIFSHRLKNMAFVFGGRNNNLICVFQL